MSDREHLERWTADGATEDEAALLAAARGGGPSAEARARIGAALGIAPTLPPPPVPKPPSAPPTVATGLAKKWLILAALGGGAAVTVASGVALRDRSSPPAAAPAASARAPAVASAPAAPSESAEPEPAPPPTVAPAPTSPPRASAPRARSSTDEELALLESAKAALDAHHPDAALASAAEYRRRYPRGMLVIEAKVIQIEALAEARRDEEARAAAEAFLRAHPNAPQATRVRSLLREIDARP